MGQVSRTEGHGEEVKFSSNGAEVHGSVLRGRVILYDWCS